MKFQSNFPLVKLVDVAPITTERVSQFDGQKPYVATADVQDGQIVASVDVDYKNKPSRADISVKAKDVIFASMQSTNKVLLIDNTEEKYIFSTGFAVCRPTQKIFPKYLKYWLVSAIFNEQKDSYCTGATQKAIPNSGIEKLFIPLPSRPEQERIVRLLDEAESLRATRERANTRMEQFVPALFQEMFGNPLQNPKKFEVIKFQGLINFITSGSRGWARYYSQSGKVFIRVQNLSGHKLNLNDIAFVNPPDTIEAKRARVSPYDILLAITGNTIGLTAIAPNDLDEAYVSQHVAIIRLNNSVDPIYIYALLTNQDGGQFQIKGNQYGHTKPGISLEQIKNFDIMLPPLALQREFAARVEEARGVQSAQGKSAGRVEALYQSMLSRAFAGEL